jgi:hypothetical protein
MWVVVGRWPNWAFYLACNGVLRISMSSFLSVLLNCNLQFFASHNFYTVLYLKCKYLQHHCYYYYYYYYYYCLTVTNSIQVMIVYEYLTASRLLYIPPSLTSKYCTCFSYGIYMFCTYLRTNSDYFYMQYELYRFLWPRQVLFTAWYILSAYITDSFSLERINII